MVLITVSETSNIVLTLSEKETLSEPNYLFVFQNMVTEEVVSFVKLYSDDISTSKERYNEFSIDSSILFPNKPTGFWYYKIYEQLSTSNLIPENATTLLEQGYMQLKNATESTIFVEHNSDNTYITR